MDFTITVTKTYTEEDFIGALIVIKKNKEYIERKIANGYNGSDYCVYSAKNQLKHYANKFGLTYKQAWNLVDRYSWHDLDR